MLFEQILSGIVGLIEKIKYEIHLVGYLLGGNFGLLVRITFVQPFQVISLHMCFFRKVGNLLRVRTV